MFDKLIGFALGYLLCKGMGVIQHPGDLLPDWLHMTTSSTPPHLPKGAQPVLTSTAAPFPVSNPTNMPAWPSGWRPVAKPSQGVVQRAWALLKVLQLGQRKTEMGPDGWLSYLKTKMGNGKTGVVVYEPKPTSSPSGTQPRAYS